MPDDAPRTDLPVVAIGASAGGLEACRALLKKMPGDSPAAFILVLHLDPSHDSMMVDLLSEHTALKVVQAAEGMVLRAGYLHVIPPGHYLTVAHRMLHLAGPESGKAVRLPFDVLLRALAKDAGAASAAIVLSGTGTDGSLGIADIDAAGGLVIAEDPAEADYPGMPESAVKTGCVARILRTDKIPAAIAAFVADRPVGPVQASDGPAPGPARMIRTARALTTFWPSWPGSPRRISRSTSAAPWSAALRAGWRSLGSGRMKQGAT